MYPKCYNPKIDVSDIPICRQIFRFRSWQDCVKSRMQGEAAKERGERWSVGKV